MTLQNILHVEIINPIPDTCKIFWKKYQKTAKQYQTHPKHF